jgi:hypothetical protein
VLQATTLDAKKRENHDRPRRVERMSKSTSPDRGVERRQRRRSRARARKDASATVATPLRRPRQPQIDLSGHPEPVPGESIAGYADRVAEWHCRRLGCPERVWSRPDLWLLAELGAFATGR